jgi:hypothetical protein
MARFVAVSLIAGILFAALDALINANPLAQRLYAVYRPISRTSVNVPAGVLIDLIYGFLLAGIFLLLYRSLPGDSGLLKGMSFALLVWFLRIVMSVAATWMTFNVPVGALLYTLIAGLGEMLVLGILYGLALRPSASGW